jgi:preprotein translocase subunit YajC
MSFLSLIGIQDAVAQAATTAAPAAAPAHAGGSLMSLLPTLIIFVLVFYFLLIRPQAKRAKQQRQLMESIAIGDEVVTTGGIAGKVIRLLDNNYVVLEIADNVQILVQKGSVALVLPKGTLKAM